MAPAMTRIGHYFTAFQTHVIGQAEIAMSRFSMEQALLILEREAKYKSDGPLARRASSSSSSSRCRGTGWATPGAWPPWPRTRSTPRTGATTSSPSRPAWATSISPT